MKNQDNFISHGFYTVSNAGGFEVQISDSGDAARLRDCFGSDDPKISDWFEIEYIETDENPDGLMVIDPTGYNIPLDHVMRINR